MSSPAPRNNRLNNPAIITSSSIPRTNLEFATLVDCSLVYVARKTSILRTGGQVTMHRRQQIQRGIRGYPGLGRELEKLAIDSMALASLNRIRARAAETGADKMTPAQITAVIKATRRVRA